LCQKCRFCIDGQDHVVVQSLVFHKLCFTCGQCGRVS
jgi:hypothetical protein